MSFLDMLFEYSKVTMLVGFWLFVSGAVVMLSILIISYLTTGNSFKQTIKFIID